MSLLCVNLSDHSTVQREDFLHSIHSYAQADARQSRGCMDVTRTPGRGAGCSHKGECHSHVTDFALECYTDIKIEKLPIKKRPYLFMQFIYRKRILQYI